MLRDGLHGMEVFMVVRHHEIDFAAANNPAVSVLPRIEERPDGTYLSIPVEAGYDISEVKLPPGSGSMGATSMGGPPVLAYMLAGQDSATTNRSNIIVYFTVLEVMVLVVLLVRDLIEVDAVIRGAVLTPMFMAVGYLGARGFRQSSEQLYRRIALVMLSLIALFGLLR